MKSDSINLRLAQSIKHTGNVLNAAIGGRRQYTPGQAAMVVLPVQDGYRFDGYTETLPFECLDEVRELVATYVNSFKESP